MSAQYADPIGCFRSGCLFPARPPQAKTQAPVAAEPAGVVHHVPVFHQYHRGDCLDMPLARDGAVVVVHRVKSPLVLVQIRSHMRRSARLPGDAQHGYPCLMQAVDGGGCALANTAPASPEIDNDGAPLAELFQCQRLTMNRVQRLLGKAQRLGGLAPTSSTTSAGFV